VLRLNLIATEGEICKLHHRHRRWQLQQAINFKIRLKEVMGDIKVTTMILKSTDCGAKKFLQLENSDEKHGGNPGLEPKGSRVGQGPHCIESALHTLEIAL
jgi:hypothetical protein